MIRFSFIIGNWWIKLHYPDSGIYRWSTRRWKYNERWQKLSNWRRVL